MAGSSQRAESKFLPWRRSVPDAHNSLPSAPECTTDRLREL